MRTLVAESFRFIILNVVFDSQSNYHCTFLCIREKLSTASDASASTVVGQQPVSATERKIVRMMIIVFVCSFICWFPANICMVIYTFYPVSFIAIDYVILTMLAYLNVVANPIIYGAHFGATDQISQAICARFSHKIGAATSSVGCGRSSKQQHQHIDSRLTR
jgi:hypothetical protein